MVKMRQAKQLLCCVTKINYHFLLQKSFSEEKKKGIIISSTTKFYENK